MDNDYTILVVMGIWGVIVGVCGGAFILYVFGFFEKNRP